MASCPHEVAAQLDLKYKIRRPSYCREDLEELQKYMFKEQKRNPAWKDFWVEEPTLIRFLKANITVQEALEALITYCEWRVEYDVDNISPDDKDIQKESSIGRDKILDNVKDLCGRTIIIIYPRYHDMYHNNYQSLYKYVMFQLEQLTAICDQDTDTDGTFCLIFDLKGLALRNMDYTAIKKILWILKNCYPERLGVCLIINYPWMFYGCWEIIKLWLNDVTRSKIFFCTHKEVVDFVDLKQCKLDL